VAGLSAAWAPTIYSAALFPAVRAPDIELVRAISTVRAPD
jgi:hypothetical protein